MSKQKNPEVSIVVPLYDEEDNVVPLCTAVRDALDSWEHTYELILVDDGSRDRTLDRMADQLDADGRIRVVTIKSNVGQTRAMLAGFARSRGPIVVSMDGDLQNDPQDIPLLVSKLAEGFDLVCGWRKDRKDAWLSRVLPSKVANWLIAKLTRIHIHDTGCSLKAYRSELIRSLKLYSNMHRFLPALSSLAGARIAEIEVRHHPRTRGSNKYGISRTFEVLGDIVIIRMLSQFASRPGRWFVWMGAPWLVIAVLVVVAWVTGHRVLHPSDSIVFQTVAILSFYVAAQMISLSILSETFLAHSDRKYVQRLVEVLTVAAQLPTRRGESPAPERADIPSSGRGNFNSLDGT